MSACRKGGSVTNGDDGTFFGPPGAAIPPTALLGHLKHPRDQWSNCVWPLVSGIGVQIKPWNAVVVTARSSKRPRAGRRRSEQDACHG